MQLETEMEMEVDTEVEVEMEMKVVTETMFKLDGTLGSQQSRCLHVSTLRICAHKQQDVK